MPDKKVSDETVTNPGEGNLSEDSLSERPYDDEEASSVALYGSVGDELEVGSGADATKDLAALIHAVADDADEPELEAEMADDPVPAANLTPEQLRTKEIEELKKKYESLTGDELKRAQYLQQTLTNLAVLYVDVQRSVLPGNEEKDRQKLLDAIKLTREKIALEREAGVFGPASRDAFTKYADWLHSKAVPEAVKEIDSLQLSIPAGCPIGLPADRYQRSISPELYRALASNNELKAEFNVDTAKVPTEAQLAKLDSAYEWLAKCNDAASGARGEHQERMLNRMLDDLNRQQWKRKDGEDAASWRSSAAEMIDLTTRMRNYVEAMQSLYKASRNGDFPMDLPRNTRLTIESNGRTYEITEKDLSDPVKKALIKNGSIKDIKLDLPEDLRQDTPANQQKIERMRDWIKQHGDKIDQAVKELIDLEKNPTAVIMYGDQEIRNGKGRFNAKGDFLGIVDPLRYQLQPGEELKDVNLIGYDFEVEEIKEGPNKGKFKITQTVNAELAPWYAYQNIRKFGIEKLGKMPIDEKIVDADDFVPVRNGDKIEITKAKHLQAFKNGQQFCYWGEKVLIATMDAAMLVSGSIEVGVAVRGMWAANAALKLTAGQAAKEIAKGSLRVAVAGAGVLNGAGGRSLKWGEWHVGEHVNTARGLYFLGDVSLGLARGGWGLFKAGKAAESLTAAEKVHTLIHGREAINGLEALKGTPILREVHTGTTWAFKATEYAFAPVIATELAHQWHKLQTLGARDPATDAVILVGDGRGLQAVKKGSFDPKDKKALEGAQAVLDGYAATLKDGRPDAIKTKIQEITDETKRLLGADIKPEDRTAYIEKMLGEIAFTGDEIRDLELAHPSCSRVRNFSLTDEQLHSLRDPEKRKAFPKPVQELAERILASKNADVEAIARISMLYLSRDADGKVAEVTGRIRRNVPEYQKDYIEVVHSPKGGSSTRTTRVTVAARDANEKMTAADVVADLKRDFETSSLGNRGIVTGEALSRIGAITHQQYAGVLQDVLLNPGSTKENRMRALTDAYGARLSTIIDGVRYQESIPLGDMSAVERERILGSKFGLSSKELIATLEHVAKTDKDQDVRSLASAQLYGIKERDPRRRAELLSAFNTLVQENAGKDAGTIAKQIKDFLTKEMNTTLPENAAAADFVKERRLNAAAALILMSDPADKATQNAINKAIVDSFSSNNPAISVRVVEMMLPNRIAQLTVEDAALANRFRANIVTLVKLPENRAQEEALVRVLQKIEPLLAAGDRELKQQLQKQLEGLLNNNAYNKEYAEFFPSLRAAAITALADIGSQSSLELIRSHASAQPKLKVGAKEIDANESNSVVRFAAVRALERLRDPELRSYVADLIDKETDPTVATQLRDIKFAQQRIEPESREYKEAYEGALKDLINPFNQTKYPHLKDFGEGAAVEWLNRNFPLLNAETARERAQTAVNNATSWIYRRTSLTETIEYEEWKKASEVYTQRGKEWDQLEALAKGTGEQADKARMALYYLMTSTRVGGMMGSESGLSIHIKGYYRDTEKVYKFYNHDWQAFAARALVDCAKPGCASRDLTAHIIEMGLGYTAGLNSDTAGSRLLFAMQELAKANTGNVEPRNFCVAREKLARIYAKALELELKRPRADQREWYQSELVKELKGLGHRMMFPAFEALSQRSPFEGVKKAAADALTEMRDSVSLMWTETEVDQTSSSAARADKVKAAVDDKKNAEKTVQEIFNAYKGFQITDAKDPGLPHLQVALSDNNLRVKLAAAKILVESKLPNNHPVKAQAIKTLAELVITGTADGYRTDAYAELSRLQLDRPLQMILSDGRLLKLERVNGKIQGSEFTGNKQTGFLYAGGGSFRFKEDSTGKVTHIWDNGVEHRRKQQGAAFIDEWERDRGMAPWKGQYTVNPDGSYWYQSHNSKDRWTRNTSGVWAKTVMATP
ncbi:MAG: HEAT repeat domain-containing protein [Candidatus Obscuribacterales bacterium]|nr:HEAT repeat domain-containing protein [Candidatus Obscuribacterales bacterium]